MLTCCVWIRYRKSVNSGYHPTLFFIRENLTLSDASFIDPEKLETVSCGKKCSAVNIKDTAHSLNLHCDSQSYVLKKNPATFHVEIAILS